MVWCAFCKRRATHDEIHHIPFSSHLSCLNILDFANFQLTYCTAALFSAYNILHNIVSHLSQWGRVWHCAHVCCFYKLWNVFRKWPKLPVPSIFANILLDIAFLIVCVFVYETSYCAFVMDVWLKCGWWKDEWTRLFRATEITVPGLGVFSMRAGRASEDQGATSVVLQPTTSAPLLEQRHRYSGSALQATLQNCNNNNSDWQNNGMANSWNKFAIGNGHIVDKLRLNWNFKISKHWVDTRRQIKHHIEVECLTIKKLTCINFGDFILQYICGFFDHTVLVLLQLS